ncbi:glycosyltransferase family 2 protein [uncultured Lacinutrix sp.]|uniref:glycosyltransferase family 2 protein n=1 Tax=uncultured Lacinutrix sp. TaxID=574032 RepID=UPI0026107EFE|nr:glycosyltransferase family 2 protein [uncultured Lacinutrix sp.]
MRVTVIIVTYNGSKWIEECLNSLNESICPVNTIVIDNKSQDETCHIVLEKFPEVKLIESKENLGFGKANNLGIKIALDLGCDYFFLLNQDAFVEPNTIGNLVSASKNNPDYGIISPIHCVWEKDQLDEAFTNYVSVKNNPLFLSHFVLNKSKKEIYSIPFVAASGWLLTRKCIETIGGFDPIFFYLGEDVNYCQRVLYHNLKIGVVPNALFYHDTKRRGEKKSSKRDENHHFDFKNKMKFANPLNNNMKIEESKMKRHLQKQIVKQIISLRFFSAKHSVRKLKKIKSIIKQAAKSRKINVVKGSHYIN